MKPTKFCVYHSKVEKISVSLRALLRQSEPDVKWVWKLSGLTLLLDAIWVDIKTQFFSNAELFACCHSMCQQVVEGLKE